MIPGTKVFYGDPLMKLQPAKIVAAAKIVLAETFSSDFLMEASRFSQVSF